MTARHALARAAALAVVAVVALVACGKRDVPERFGREMVLGTSLPADAIERFNAFVPAPRKPGTSAIDALAADTESWRAASDVTVSANANQVPPNNNTAAHAASSRGGHRCPPSSLPEPPAPAVGRRRGDADVLAPASDRRPP